VEAQGGRGRGGGRVNPDLVVLHVQGGLSDDRWGEGYAAGLALGAFCVVAFALLCPEHAERALRWLGRPLA
jgi:hypothetical protein